jgi:outer membrane protein with beta-barrel domain
MQKLFLIAALTMALPVLAQAQEAPRTEFFGGYSYMRLEDSGIDGQDRDLNGYNVSGTVTVFKKYLSLKVDVSGHFGDLVTNVVPRVDQGLTLFMAGPQFTFRKYERFQPFAHVLFGAGRQTLEAPALGFNNTDVGFAYAVGGGLDLRTPLGSKVGVRAFQADFVRTKFQNVSTGNLRVSTGIVLRFGNVE